MDVLECCLKDNIYHFVLRLLRRQHIVSIIRTPGHRATGRNICLWRCLKRNLRNVHGVKLSPTPFPFHHSGQIPKYKFFL
ncbi:hypothetical protein XELAEV_18008380mg [Xenopus laevis]|uniref:Uncharacterized protein n=1 Tax=Xenopus laevis TaxID=8355 RepID=A0A974I679_XENLA|nr:hypothetical protein XELAEV_18008380mg [Xenopus laevis]